MESERQPPSGPRKVEGAKTVVIVALFADALQIAGNLGAALIDPTQWRSFWVVSSIAAAFLVLLILITLWKDITSGRRILGVIFIVANIFFVISYTHPGLIPLAIASPPVSSPMPSPSSTVATSSSSGAVITTSPTASATSTTKVVTPTTVTKVVRAPGAPTPGAPVDPQGTWTVSAASSKAGSASDLGPQVATRFWSYPSGNATIGDLRFENGGLYGTYAWAPIAIGSDCAVPYVIYFFGGVSKGEYKISAHVPDIDNLGVSAQYGNDMIDQSAHRGQWVQLSDQTASQGNDGGYSLVVNLSQGYSSFGSNSGCAASSQRIAFDAVRVTLSSG
jgi:hypothetical protein